MRSLGNANYWHKVTRTEGRCSPTQTVQSVQMTDSVQLNLRQRATIMLKVCELAESHRPETHEAMTPAEETRSRRDLPTAQPPHGSAAGRKLARRLVIMAYRTA